MAGIIAAALYFLALPAPALAASYVVDTTADNGALSACTSAPGDCSLRGAVARANGTGPGDVITFDPAVFPALPSTATITLTLGPVPLTAGGDTIDASGLGVVVTNPGNPCVDIASSGNTVKGLQVISCAEGIYVLGDTNTITGNTASASTPYGIFVSGGANTVKGNKIGTNPSGTAVNANGGNDIGLHVDTGSGNIIGGSSPGDANIISGNGGNGLDLNSGTSLSVVKGNFIGTDISGTVNLGNGGQGLYEAGVSDTIGGPAAGEGNVISGSGLAGIYLIALGNGGDTIQGNKIGTDVSGTVAMGNGAMGIRVFASSLTIGGTAPGAGNTIAYNTNAGIAVITGVGVQMRGNSIFSNGALGIDLGNNGVTLNDAGDSDTGINNLQNFPVVTSAASLSGTTSIQGTLNTTPNLVVAIDFFANTSGTGCDPSTYGEGRRYLGSVSGTADGSGNLPFNQSFTASLGTGDSVTATATDTNGNTSEFSQCFVLTSGDADGDGVADASDNCPNWYNPSQALPVWPIASSDPDCDGFSASVETFVGTDPASHCGTNAWPPDFNSDAFVNLTDVLLMRPHFASTLGNANYSARFDLNADNSINLTDVLKMRPFFSHGCT